VIAGDVWTVWVRWRATPSTPAVETGEHTADWADARSRARGYTCMYGTRYVTVTGPGGVVAADWDEYRRRWREYRPPQTGA